MFLIPLFLYVSKKMLDKKRIRIEYKEKLNQLVRIIHYLTCMHLSYLFYYVFFFLHFISRFPSWNFYYLLLITKILRLNINLIILIFIKLYDNCIYLLNIFFLFQNINAILKKPR